MKLEIDLADREEIAAAVPLLQMILTNTPKTCGGQCSHEVTPSLYEEGRAALAADTRPPVHAQETVTLRVPADVAAAVEANPAGAAAFISQAAQDPAAVFGGGAVAPAPLAASIPPPATPNIVVPPPPANIAPTTPTHGVASSGAVASSVDLDSKGLPWDERIHAGSKAKVKDGSWRMKKELDPAHVAAVEAELRGRMSGNLVVPTASTPPLVAPVGASSPTITASLPVAPAIDPAAVFGGAAVASEPTTFEQLMPRITAAVTAGLMPATAVGAACASQGLASVVMLQQSPQFVPLVWATLKQQYPGV